MKTEENHGKPAVFMISNPPKLKTLSKPWFLASKPWFWLVSQLQDKVKCPGQGKTFTFEGKILPCPGVAVFKVFGSFSLYGFLRVRLAPYKIQRSEKGARPPRSNFEKACIPKQCLP